MSLSKNQNDRVQQVWQTYVSRGEKFYNAGKEYSYQELDQRRRDTIPEVMGWITRFLQGTIPLEEFKTGLDGANKRSRLWGFQGINGQMFFNMLTKNSVAGDRLEEFANLLKKSIPAPASLNEARSIIKAFESYTKDLGKNSEDRRAAPKVGSILFFLSYFWQIQQPDKYPIFYSSMVNVLSDLDIWSPSGEVTDDYVTFYELNYEMLNMLSKTATRQLHLWDIEHAFWLHGQLMVQEPPEPPGRPNSKSSRIDWR